MAVNVIGTLKPKNNGSFAVVEGSDVTVIVDGVTMKLQDAIAQGKIGAKTEVSVVPNSQNMGADVATITVNGTDYCLRAPEFPEQPKTEVSVNSYGTGNAIADITVDGNTTTIYAPQASGDEGGSSIIPVTELPEEPVDGALYLLVGGDPYPHPLPGYGANLDGLKAILNASLSVDEVVNICRQLYFGSVSSVLGSSMAMYYVTATGINEDNPNGDQTNLVIIHILENDCYVIANVAMVLYMISEGTADDLTTMPQLYFTSKDLSDFNIPFVGWNPTLTLDEGYHFINLAGTNASFVYEHLQNEYNHCQQNDKLIKLLYTFDEHEFLYYHLRSQWHRVITDTHLLSDLRGTDVIPNDTWYYGQNDQFIISHMDDYFRGTRKLLASATMLMQAESVGDLDLSELPEAFRDFIKESIVIPMDVIRTTYNDDNPYPFMYMALVTLGGMLGMVQIVNGEITSINFEEIGGSGGLDIYPDYSSGVQISSGDVQLFVPIPYNGIENGANYEFATCDQIQTYVKSQIASVAGGVTQQQLTDALLPYVSKADLKTLVEQAFDDGDTGGF